MADGTRWPGLLRRLPPAHGRLSSSIPPSRTPHCPSVGNRANSPRPIPTPTRRSYLQAFRMTAPCMPPKSPSATALDAEASNPPALPSPYRSLLAPSLAARSGMGLFFRSCLTTRPRRRCFSSQVGSNPSGRIRCRCSSWSGDSLSQSCRNRVALGLEGGPRIPLADAETYPT
jgi:hypothetical protein